MMYPPYEQKPTIGSGAKVIATILAICLVFTLIPSLFIVPVEQVLLNANTYKQAMQDNDFYNVFQHEAIAESQTGDTSSMLPPEQMNALIEAAIPPAWVQDQFEGIVQQFFDYLNQKTDRFRPVLDMTPVKDNLTTAFSNPDIIKTLFASMPACSSDQLAHILEMIQSGLTPTIPSCLPTDELITVLSPFIVDFARSSIDTLPDEIPLMEGNDADMQFFVNQQSQDFQTFVMIRSILWIFPIASLVFIVLIILLMLRSFKSMGAWLGVPMVVSGLIGLGITLVLLLLGNEMAITMSAQINSTASQAIEEVVMGAIRQIATNYVLWAGLFSFASLGIGVLLLIVPRVVGRQNELSPMPY